jgi:hypothetical protein
MKDAGKEFQYFYEFKINFIEAEEEFYEVFGFNPER